VLPSQGGRVGPRHLIIKQKPPHKGGFFVSYPSSASFSLCSFLHCSCSSSSYVISPLKRILYRMYSDGKHSFYNTNFVKRIFESEIVYKL
ncbi:hypothetical protein Q0590_12220, partial [Rhodocytophaga aerolata]